MNAQPDAGPLPDLQLIVAWRDGDEAAAAELVRRHTGAVARFLHSSGADRDAVGRLKARARKPWIMRDKK